MKKKLVLLVLLFINNFSFAQNPAELKQRLSGKTKLTDIMKEVDLFYKDEQGNSLIPTENGEKEFENNYLRWMRWEYYQSSRLDEEGRVTPNVNRKIYDGLNNYQYNRNVIGNESSYSYWNSFGPTTVVNYGPGYSHGNGRVNCIAFHPTNPNSLIIGTPQAGIWRSFNNGTNWFILSNSLPANSIGGLVWDRTNSNIIYALTGDGDEAGISGFVTAYGFSIPSLGVFKSLDGGISWQETGEFPATSGNFHGYKLIQHPVNANTLYAATTVGIYKTTDGGNSWLLVQSGSFTDLEFKPGNPDIMYAAEYSTSSPFWRSTNSGDSWNTASTGISTNTTRIAIGVSASQPDYIYVLAGGSNGNGKFQGMYRNTLNGTPNFVLQSNTPNILSGNSAGAESNDQAGYDLAIEVNPLNANTIITGGINIWQSTDAGVTYGGQCKAYWVNNSPGFDYVHADIHNLTYNPLNNNLYCVTDGGVGYSTNNGANWTFIPNNLGILATYHGDFYEGNADIMVSGTQDNGTNVRYTNSDSYRHIYGGDGFDCVIKNNDPNSIVYVVNDVLFKTTDGGITPQYVPPANSIILGFFPHLAKDYNNDTRIFAAGTYNVYRSTDFGSTWTSFNMDAIGRKRALTTCPSNSDRLYVSNGSMLQRSDNATTALTFTTISGTPGYPSGVNLTDIETRPSNSSYVYACFGGYTAEKKVYFSTDGGDNWTNISGTLPNIACHSIAVDASNTVYVGTDAGVFVRSELMDDWQPFYNYLPRTPVSELMVNNSAGRIIACTFGHGNFYSNLYSTCPENLNVTGSFISSSFYEASSTITSTATATQGAGNTTALKAGDFVRLDPGFEVKSSNEMRAYINPCNTGGVPFTFKNINDVNPTDRLYVPAQEGVRFASAKISKVNPDKSGAEIEILREGKYAIRITDSKGKIFDIPFTDKQYSSGNFQINWNKADLKKGQYFIQLFKEKQLVHFQEFDVK